jgi:hypothetical protein
MAFAKPSMFSPDQHAQAAALLADFSAHYLAGVAHRPVVPKIDGSTLAALRGQAMPRVGQSLPTLFEEFEQVVVPNSTHTAHPRFLAAQP